jgi:ribonuclease D
MPDARASVPITTAAQLDDLIAHLRAAGRFGFDTEFVSETTFAPVLGLIQVATRERLALIDPLAVGDLSAFWDVLHDPSVEVVMHAAGEDLRIARLLSGRLPGRVVDVQVAAGLVGYGYPSALSHLVRRGLGVNLHGGATRTDWLRRPLSDEQLRYALDDVRHLLDLADVIEARLDAQGRRPWAEQEYQALLRTVAARDDEERWRRTPGLAQLNRRSLEAARRLWLWRRDEARRIDRPVRQVLRDDLLVAIAKRMPAGPGDLEALREFARSPARPKAPAILRVIAEARGVAPEELPRAIERPDDAPGLGMVVNLLSAVLNRSCAEHGLSAGLVGTASDLRDLLRWHLEGRPESNPPALASGWRGEVCGQMLEDVLAGRRALRIVDPGSDVPIAIDAVADIARDEGP